MKNRMDAGWFYSGAQIRRYLATRISSLRPPKTNLRNPYLILRELSRHQWLMFLSGFLGWIWDAFDFFSVTMTVTELATAFDVSTSAVTWGIAVTLMLRSVGALLFGVMADHYGRKYVMIFNLFLFIVLELGTGFCNTLGQFIGVRALYGIAMGGLFGPAAATALEDLPRDARGLLSGLFEQGYGIGYMLAAAFYRALVPTTPHGWRSLFWFGAAPPVFIIAFRWALPETSSFKVMKARHRAAGEESNKVTLKESLKITGQTCRQNWVLLVYMTLLMAFFSFCSHGSQDFYPTFLKTQANMSATNTSLVTIIGQLGALTGGITVGYVSTFFGNRLTIICVSLLGAAAVPGFVLPRGMNILAGAFFQQLLVGGAWGPIPIHLVELSPPAIKSLSVGLTAQLGNLASAGSSTIQATMAKRFPLPPTESYAHRYDYGLVILIFLEVAWACIFLTALLGPEMSQEERAAEAEATAYHESLRSAGVDLEQAQIKKAVGAAEDELDDIKGATEHREVE